MPYKFFVVTDDMLCQNGHTLRKALFNKMQQEGLLPSTMKGYLNPSLEQWLHITNPRRGWLLCCHSQKFSNTYCTDNIYAMAFIAPWAMGIGRVWTFDFTVFRKHFTKATDMSHKALDWIFIHAPCDSLLGLCAQSNVHAWRLAQKSGFKVLGRIPNACFIARKNIYEDGVLVLASRNNKHLVANLTC